MILRLCVIFVLLLPPPVFAQGTGPFGGLFGRRPERTGRTFTGLDFRTSAGGQYEDAVLLDEETPLEERPPSGTAAGASASLNFQRATNRLQLNLSSTVSQHQYLSPQSYGATTVGAEAQVVGDVSTRLSVQTAAGYRRSPFFEALPTLYDPLLSSGIYIPGTVMSTRSLMNDTWTGMAGFTARYSKRSTFHAGASRRETRFANAPGNNFSMDSVEAIWTRRMTDDVGLHAGYRLETATPQAASDERFIHETFDIGLDFTRELSLARRTSLAFGAGTSAVRERGGARRYRLNGDITLSRAFKRTWGTGVGVHRETQFLAGFFQPVLSDRASAFVSGLLSRRVEWLASVGGGRGQFGFDASTTFLNAGFVTRTNVAVTRHVALYGQYSFYHYEISTDVPSIGLRPQLDRQAIAVGISVWVPIINQVRAPRDPR